MNRLLTSTIIVSSLFFGVLSLLLVLFFPVLAPFLVSFTGRRLALYIHFGRLACFTNFLFVIGNAFGQYQITTSPSAGHLLRGPSHTIGGGLRFSLGGSKEGVRGGGY